MFKGLYKMDLTLQWKWTFHSMEFTLCRSVVLTLALSHKRSCSCCLAVTLALSLDLVYNS
jgi:hypothetical protein